MGGNASCLLPGVEADDSASESSSATSAIDVNTLVLPHRHRHFPLKVPQREKADGECLLYLEHAHNVAYGGLLGSFNCEAVASRARGKPFVQAWAMDEKGNVLGKAAKWPAKSSNANPSWYSAQPLGFPLAGRSRTSLCIELWEDRTLLGSLVTPLGDIPVHCAVTRELERRDGGASSKKPCQVSFQVLDSSALSDQRVIFFVRHGESVWNKAQDSLQLHEMARTTDHPLSSKGRQQAEALSKRLAKAAKQADAAVEQLLHPEAVYVSPLTRAIQTAVIAFGPTVTKKTGLGEMTLMANAREKQNFGGLDTRSTKIGADVLQNSLNELRALYGGEDRDVLDIFAKLRFDAKDVEDHWWFDGMAESSAQLQARMQEFMSQLLYSPHRAMVVVGHSHFFRSVFKAFLSNDFCEENKELAGAISSKKLMNCGVVRVELDPRRGISGGPIIGVELVLDTRLDADGGPLSCCAADQHTSGDEELFSPDVPGDAYPAALSPGRRPL